MRPRNIPLLSRGFAGCRRYPSAAGQTEGAAEAMPCHSRPHPNSALHARHHPRQQGGALHQILPLNVLMRGVRPHAH